uniref:Uncharacterized protein n=1 Tax=Helianthus annuus TaxID=4232 RepID=A0A251TIM0_HELAN
MLNLRCLLLYCITLSQNTTLYKRRGSKTHTTQILVPLLLLLLSGNRLHPVNRSLYQIFNFL